MLDAGFCIMAVICACLLVLSIILLMGKGGFLIAGFNTMPKEQREKFDEKALCTFMGKIMLVITAAVFLGVVCDNTVSDIICAVTIAGTVIFALAYANTKQRFIKKEYKK